jgi:Phospholipase A2-like domain
MFTHLRRPSKHRMSDVFRPLEVHAGRMIDQLGEGFGLIEDNKDTRVGEKHMYLRLPNGRFKRANYAGPGTDLINRLRADSKPVTQTDTVAQMHDINYAFAKNPEDMRSADMRMIKTLDRIEKEKLDSRFNTTLARAGIKAKVALEKAGIAGPTTFTTIGGNYSADDITLMRAKRHELEQQGFGKPDPLDKLKRLAAMSIRKTSKSRKATKRGRKRAKVYRMLKKHKGMDKARFIQMFADKLRSN